MDTYNSVWYYNFEMLKDLFKCDMKFENNVKNIHRVFANQYVLNSDTNRYYILDDHIRPPLNQRYIDMIGVSLKTVHDYDKGEVNMQDIWLFYYYKGSPMQCKNSLYVSNNQVHISCESKGTDLSSSIHQKLLLDGHIVTQGSKQNQMTISELELTFVLPMDVFMDLYEMFPTKDAETEDNVDVDIDEINLDNYDLVVYI